MTTILLAWCSDPPLDAAWDFSCESAFDAQPDKVRERIAGTRKAVAAKFMVLMRTYRSRIYRESSDALARSESNVGESCRGDPAAGSAPARTAIFAQA